jgi:hypothetical protein
MMHFTVAPLFAALGSVAAMAAVFITGAACLVAGWLHQPAQPHEALKYGLPRFNPPIRWLRAAGRCPDSA